MWPFKKKIIEIRRPERPVFNSVICIPGYWNDAIEIFGQTEGKFMVVGDTIIDVENQRHYKFEMYGHNSEMRESFKLGGIVTQVTEDFLRQINEHVSVIYITGNTGNFEKARLLAKLAELLCESGGIGVRVETSGKAFEKDRWIELSSQGTDANIYELFVIDSLVLHNGTTYSCGMHNLGLMDVIVSGVEFREAHKLVRMFNYHRIIDKPVIKSGETFSLDIDSPKYLIIEEHQQLYDVNSLFYNPFGIWRLVRR